MKGYIRIENPVIEYLDQGMLGEPHILIAFGFLLWGKFFFTLESNEDNSHVFKSQDARIRPGEIWFRSNHVGFKSGELLKCHIEDGRRLPFPYM